MQAQNRWPFWVVILFVNLTTSVYSLYWQSQSSSNNEFRKRSLRQIIKQSSGSARSAAVSNMNQSTNLQTGEFQESRNDDVISLSKSSNDDVSHDNVECAETDQANSRECRFLGVGIIRFLERFRIKGAVFLISESIHEEVRKYAKLNGFIARIGIDDENNIEKMRSIVVQLADVSTRTFVLVCSSVCSSLVLQLAAEFQMNGAEFAWLIVAEIPTQHPSLPINSIKFQAIRYADKVNHTSSTYSTLMKP